MPAIENINPVGEVEVPLLRRIVGAGEIIDVTDEQAAALLPQTDNWRPAKVATRKADTPKDDA